MEHLDISEIELLPLPKHKGGLVAFASCILNRWLYLGNMGIYTAPHSSLGFRLTFPTKILHDGRKIEIFHPITRGAGEQITQAIIRKYFKVLEKMVAQSLDGEKEVEITCKPRTNSRAG